MEWFNDSYVMVYNYILYIVEIYTNFIMLQIEAHLRQVTMFYGKPNFDIFKKINMKIL